MSYVVKMLKKHTLYILEFLKWSSTLFLVVGFALGVLLIIVMRGIMKWSFNSLEGVPRGTEHLLNSLRCPTHP